MVKIANPQLCALSVKANAALSTEKSAGRRFVVFSISFEIIKRVLLSAKASFLGQHIMV